MHGYPQKEVSAISQALKDEKLTFGYGLYWDAGAPAVSWRNHFNIEIRRIIFDGRTKGITNKIAWRTSPIFQDEADIVPQPRRQFLILQHTFYVDPCGNNKETGCRSSLTEQVDLPEKLSFMKTIYFRYGTTLCITTFQKRNDKMTNNRKEYI